MILSAYVGEGGKGDEEDRRSKHAEVWKWTESSLKGKCVIQLLDTNTHTHTHTHTDTHRYFGEEEKEVGDSTNNSSLVSQTGSIESLTVKHAFCTHLAIMLISFASNFSLTCSFYCLQAMTYCSRMRTSRDPLARKPQRRLTTNKISHFPTKVFRFHIQDKLFLNFSSITSPPPVDFPIFKLFSVPQITSKAAKCLLFLRPFLVDCEGRAPIFRLLITSTGVMFACKQHHRSQSTTQETNLANGFHSDRARHSRSRPNRLFCTQNGALNAISSSLYLPQATMTSRKRGIYMSYS